MEPEEKKSHSLQHRDFSFFLFINAAENPPDGAKKGRVLLFPHMPGKTCGINARMRSFYEKRTL